MKKQRFIPQKNALPTSANNTSSFSSLEIGFAKACAAITRNTTAVSSMLTG